MDATFLSFLLFLLITAGYFQWGSPKVLLTNGNFDIGEYYKNIPVNIGLYLLTILFFQLILNIIYLTSKCGGFNSGKNIPTAMIFTFVPWIFIFGVLAGLLFVYPHLKTAFSNVIGYFVIAGSADVLLSKMLKGTDVVMQNTGILVNNITPDNFEHIWKELQKKLVKPDSGNLWKQELIELVVKKEAIGEAIWYIYSAIFVISIVYYNLASKGCIKDPATMKKERDEYIKTQEAKADQAKNSALTYHV